MSLIYHSGDQSHENLLHGEQTKLDPTKVEILLPDSSGSEECSSFKDTESVTDEILTDENGIKEQEVPDSVLGKVSSESIASTPSPTPQYHRSTSSTFFRSRENPEISPFKEAKDFVLSKLSKKLGPAEGSHIPTDCDKRTLLSGLKEIIAKKIEDKIGKDSSHTHGVVPVATKGDKTGNLSINYTVDSNSKVTIKELDSVYKGPCELKSVVANDLESSVIEEAHECVEELNGSFSEPEDLESEFLNMTDPCPPPTPPPRSKTISNIAAAAHSVLSPKKNKGKELPMSYSFLKKTNDLDVDCLEEGDEEVEESIELKEISEADGVGIKGCDSEVLQSLKERPSPQVEEPQTKNVQSFLHRFYPKQICNLFNHSSFQVHFLVALVSAFVCYYWSLSSYSAGFVNGVLISSVVAHLLIILTRKSQPKNPLQFPTYKTLPPLSLVMTVAAETSSHKGWMNELHGQYNPETFRISSLNSVYVYLEGSYLVLSYPKKNVPRRAMWNEKEHNPTFVRHSHHFLAGAKVSIVPEGLAKIRIWNKKYPLCLTFPDQIKGTRSASLERRVRRASCEFDEKKSMETHSLPNSLSGSPAHQASASEKSVIYLFARADREKEEWFWRFSKACQGQHENYVASKPSNGNQTGSSSSTDLTQISTTQTENMVSDQEQLVEPSVEEEEEEEESVSRLPEKGEMVKVPEKNAGATLSEKNEGSRASEKAEAARPVRKKPVLDFQRYMHALLERKANIEDTTPSSSKDLPSVSYISPNPVHWLNVFLGRLFYDFLTQEYWANRVKNRIQKKLTRVKVPLMDEFQVTDIYLGTSLPQIERASEPIMDSRGVWIDLDIEYNGSVQMTLETKLNLTGVARCQVVPSVVDAETDIAAAQVKSIKYEGSDDDSPESSDEEDLPEATDGQSAGYVYQPEAVGTGQKIIGLLEKILQSKRFQNMAENKFIKRAVNEVSNTPLVLTVELHGLFGTLALNIPPLPTDRLWMGFRTNPELSLSAYPKLGDREINYSQITEMIEKKLRAEFQKILVMPNMEDILIPTMHSTLYDQQ